MKARLFVLLALAASSANAGYLEVRRMNTCDSGARSLTGRWYIESSVEMR